MFGCFYLILAVLLGKEITRPLLSEQKIKEKGVTPFWVGFSCAFGSGVLLLTWAVYIAAWLLSVCGGMETPLLGADLIVMLAAGCLLALIYYKRRHSLKEIREVVCREIPPGKEIAFFLVLLALITWIMFSFSCKRRIFIFWIYCIWGLCTSYCNDEILFSWQQFSDPVSALWR